MTARRLQASAMPLILAAALAAPSAADIAGIAGAAARLSAAPAPMAAAPAAAATHRVGIPSADGKPLPYSLEIPTDWQVQPSKELGGVFVGPAGISQPKDDPRMIFVRESSASLADPAAVAANIKKNQPADASWTAPLVEVRELSGVRGVVLRMDSGSGELARSTLVLKMPLGQGSLDFMASAPRAEFERRLAGYRAVLFSIQPAH
jgi:hypothetical protein